MTVKRDRLGRPNQGWSHIHPRGAQFNRLQHFRLAQDDYDELTALAKQQKVSRAELVRTYVTWGIETEKREETSL